MHCLSDAFVEFVKTFSNAVKQCKTPSSTVLTISDIFQVLPEYLEIFLVLPGTGRSARDPSTKDGCAAAEHSSYAQSDEWGETSYHAAYRVDTYARMIAHST